MTNINCVYLDSRMSEVAKWVHLEFLIKILIKNEWIQNLGNEF